MYNGVHVKEKIGSGGIADVYRAIWNDREVALKVLRDPERRGLRDRFLCEGELLKSLEHPGITRCFEVLDAVQPALVLELLVGETLHARLYRRVLTEVELIRLGTSVLRTLSFLHQHNVIHRDVKPANIFLSTDKRIILLDLGLAAINEEIHHTTLGDILGTHAYMAPEQLVGASADPRSDLYGLGVTLYEAACARQPFEAEGLTAWLAAHRSGQLIPLSRRAPYLSSTLCAAIHQFLSRDPWDRPASALAAVSVLTGSRKAHGLATPPLVGRAGLKGSIEATFDENTFLAVEGVPGSGLNQVRRLVLSHCQQHKIELIELKSPILTDLAGRLEQIFHFPVQPDPAALKAELAQLRHEGAVVLFITGSLSASEKDFLQQLPGPVFLVGTGVSGLPGHLLRRLSLEELKTLMLRMLRATELPDGFLAMMWRWSGGLPGLAVGLLRDLHEREGMVWEGIGVNGASRWRWESQVLPSVASLGLEKISQESEYVIFLMAVAGKKLSPALLKKLAGEQNVAVLQELQPEFLEVVASGLGKDQARALKTELVELLYQEGDHDAALLQEASLGRSGGRDRLLARVGELWGQGRENEALVLLDGLGVLLMEGEYPMDLASRILLRANLLTALGKFSEAQNAVRAVENIPVSNSSPVIWRDLVVSEAELMLESGWGVPEYFSEAPTSRVTMVQASLYERRAELALAMALVEKVAKESRAREGMDALFLWGRLCLLRGQVNQAKNLCRQLMGQAQALGSRFRARRAELLLGEVYLRAGRPGAAMKLLRQRETPITEEGRLLACQAVLLEAEIRLCCGQVEEAGEGMARIKNELPHLPWWLRARFGELTAMLREGYEDLPAQLEAHLAGRDAARQAGDQLYAAWHTAMLGVLGGDPDGVSDASNLIYQAGASRLVARLYLLGARVSHDPALLDVANDAAQASHDIWLCNTVMLARNRPCVFPFEVFQDLPPPLQSSLRNRYRLEEPWPP